MKKEQKQKAITFLNKNFTLSNRMVLQKQDCSYNVGMDLVTGGLYKVLRSKFGMDVFESKRICSAWKKQLCGPKLTKEEQIKRLTSLLNRAMSFAMASTAQQGDETWKLEADTKKFFRQMKQK